MDVQETPQFQPPHEQLPPHLGFFSRLYQRVRLFVGGLFTYAKAHKVIAAVVLILVLVFGYRIVTSRQAPESETERTPRVSLINVGELRESDGVIFATGEVESVAQAELKSEVSGRVSGVSVKLGDAVWPGRPLVTLDGSAQWAGVLQAEASLTSAQESVGDLQIAVLNAERLWEETRTTNTFAAVRSALNSAIDGLVVLATVQDEYYIASGLSDIIDAEDKAIEAIYGISNLGNIDPQDFLLLTGGIPRRVAQFEQNPNDPAYDPVTLINETRTALLYVQDALRLTQSGLSDALGSVEAGRASVRNATSGVLVQLNALSGQQQVILSAENSLRTAEARIVESSYSTDHALIQQAQANLLLAQSQFAKTIIRSPIYGNVSFIASDVRLGNLVNPGQLVAAVVNPSRTQVRIFIDAADVPLVRIGDSVRVADLADGVVSAVSPGISPDTGKVEVIITITSQDVLLIAGEFVNVSIRPTGFVQNTEALIIPLSAVKVTRDGSFLFSVGGEGIAEQHPVTTGRVIGNSIEILSPLSDDFSFIAESGGIESGDVTEVITP